MFSYSNSDIQKVAGSAIREKLSSAGSLTERADVKLTGIKVGSVLGLNIDPATFLAEVTMATDDRIKLPRDTMAIISAEGLLGGEYMHLEPGGEKGMLPQEDASQTARTQLI